MPESVWEIRLGVVASEAQADELKERIMRLLCPDPDHAPPCPIPWSLALMPADDDAYPGLLEQHRIESSRRG
ncbi:hypothetical protein [Amycolatopsis sp. CA-230715]|uniref:hypothetical protein n=1 Tax=Amycolatopsis sp. CA-230715 TaxID=2745196 RepID=UPI001C035649|nr:hypothetical protein [Amycolatopsis sp. CA-230715]QWF84269.1 hypothetical protein HUW46_07719 [Amycolatopsis sp. CA-230715]